MTVKYEFFFYIYHNFYYNNLHDIYILVLFSCQLNDGSYCLLIREGSLRCILLWSSIHFSSSHAGEFFGGPAGSGIPPFCTMLICHDKESIRSFGSGILSRVVCIIFYARSPNAPFKVSTLVPGNRMSPRSW